jgi:glycosyltransferase involved in cell wall biosynthesis
MNVWLVNAGEPLPIDPGPPRPFKTGMLANHLAVKGHDVTWWTSRYDHYGRRLRDGMADVVTLSRHATLILLPSRGYKKNLSFRRLWANFRTAWEFYRRARLQPKPDVIVVSMPTPDLSLAAVAWGRKHGVQVVVDVRDLWPDVFAEVLGPRLRWLARLVLAPMDAAVRLALRRSNSISANTRPTLAWASAKALRPIRATDVIWPIGYPAETPRPEDVAAAERYWDERGVGTGADQFVAAFMGTLSRHFDLETILEAAKLVAADARPITFVICGAGDLRAPLEAKAGATPNVRFTGWVNQAQIWVLLRRLGAGLAPYRNTKNFLENLPNKPAEYWSAGVPVVTCLDGVLGEIIRSERCGIAYPEGDAAALAAALRRLRDDEPARRSMAQAAAAVYTRRFHPEHVNGDFERHLENLVNRHAPRALDAD